MAIGGNRYAIFDLIVVVVAEVLCLQKSNEVAQEDD